MMLPQMLKQHYLLPNNQPNYFKHPTESVMDTFIYMQ